jgi:hypothetical protein
VYQFADTLAGVGAGPIAPLQFCGRIREVITVQKAARITCRAHQLEKGMRDEKKRFFFHPSSLVFEDCIKARKKMEIC